MDQPRLTVPEALEKLLAEGDANQIAQYLEQEGITGRRSQANHCVLAEYLLARTGARVVGVHPRGVSVKLGMVVRTNPVVAWSDGGGRGRQTSELPEELERLANSFDRGDFPSLVRKAER